MGGVADVVGDVVGGVGDIVGGAVDTIGDAGSWIDDNVLQPVLDDPLNSAIKLGAYYFGGPIAGSAATAAISAAQGNDLGDIAKSAATSYVAGQVGGTAAGEVGGAVAEGTGSSLAGNLAGGAVGGAASGATGQLISGGNVGQGFLTGLLGGGITSGVNQGANAISNAFYTGSDSGTFKMEDNFQIFDDGTSLQTFADGSAIYSDTGGQTYVLDTDSGYAQAINSATGQPIGVASNSLFDTVLKTGSSIASSALKSMLGVKSGTGTGVGGTGANTSGLLTTGANYLLSQKQLSDLRDAYAQNLALSQGSTNRAVDLAKFSPVGVTTTFGTSNYTVDPATGRIISAGYTSTPELQAAQKGLMSAGQAMIPTGNLQDQAKTFMAQQQGLLAPGREQQLAQLQNRLYQTGTSGLATGGTVAGYGAGQPGLRQTNPLASAYYNSLAQQDAQLAASAQQQALAQAQGQTSLAGSLFGQAGNLETLAQSPLTLGSNLANLQATAGGRAGQLGLLGGQGTAATQLTGALANVYGQGQALGSVVNPLAQGAQNILSNVAAKWFE